ncbi:FitA-like ribbon-helix-helix domain-containing protein [Siccirubricoccus soli]|uniref:FitA-like ribbon-helix-helix domain-containing protein n=1 Tax=Siccirubricoccus soli TaxID=2899147 RepID=UPI0038D241E2
MASLTLRNPDDGLQARPRLRAARRDRSVEAAARAAEVAGAPVREPPELSG